MQKLEAKGWYFWWEKLGFFKMPHYVIVFERRPAIYYLELITQAGEVKKIKCDPFPLDDNGVLIQKRDVMRFARSINPLKNVRIFLIQP